MTDRPIIAALPERDARRYRDAPQDGGWHRHVDVMVDLMMVSCKNALRGTGVDWESPTALAAVLLASCAADAGKGIPPRPAARAIGRLCPFLAAAGHRSHPIYQAFTDKRTHALVELLSAMKENEGWIQCGRPPDLREKRASRNLQERLLVRDVRRIAVAVNPAGLPDHYDVGALVAVGQVATVLFRCRLTDTLYRLNPVDMTIERSTAPLPHPYADEHCAAVAISMASWKFDFFVQGGAGHPPPTAEAVVESLRDRGAHRAADFVALFGEPPLVRTAVQDAARCAKRPARL